MQTNFTDAPALLRFGPNNFEVIKAGSYVLCGVTGAPIALEALRYWCVDRQIAFRDVGVANQTLAPQTAPLAEEANHLSKSSRTD